jgi:hypothetical protein
MLLNPIICAAESPDRIYECGGFVIGVELFELHQNYETRAFLDSLTNAIYDEFERRGFGDRYLGVSANVIADRPEFSIKPRVRAEWRRQGILRGQVKVFATQFVDVVVTHIWSRDDIPERSSTYVPGLHIKIDRTQYPALTAFGSTLSLIRCPVNDPRRSDSRSAPLVILSGATVYTDAEYIDCIAQRVVAKIQRRKRWPTVDRAVLIAHDIPRGHYYHSVGREWEKWLLPAIEIAGLSKHFDECWLVTGRNLNPEFEVIALYPACPDT